MGFFARQQGIEGGRFAAAPLQVRFRLPIDHSLDRELKLIGKHHRHFHLSSQICAVSLWSAVPTIPIIPSPQPFNHCKPAFSCSLCAPRNELYCLVVAFFNPLQGFLSSGVIHRHSHGDFGVPSVKFCSVSPPFRVLLVIVQVTLQVCRPGGTCGCWKTRLAVNMICPAHLLVKATLLCAEDLLVERLRRRHRHRDHFSSCPHPTVRRFLPLVQFLSGSSSGGYGFPLGI
mmetsp:Transcript_27520/g.53620  ORF Transcript_27520/g.53620 Transcript_27520/m.53620 type:complete len:230 (-) Transcript_27520:432-1121(-)